MSESAAQLAVRALREYLLAELPPKVASINTQRAAVIKSAFHNSFVIPTGAVLRIGTTRDGALTSCPLTAGTRSANQVQQDIVAANVPGITASHAANRIILTAAAPTVGTPSCVVIGSDISGVATNLVFGWATGGEHVVRAAIEAPTWRGVVDGDWTLAPDRDGGGFWVCIGNRTVRPWPNAPNVRRDEFQVSMTVDIVRRFGANQTPHRDREAIGACVRAVDDLLRTTTGRQLGRAADGDVMLVDVPEIRVASSPFDTKQGFLFDVATMTITVRIFQRAN